ncbi:uncharacterized protein LOC111087256 [Limulus polyphemus]|uniref:Uncharacterized protein LOC111087256 n=1 Tax=Limulus polyphemus TaxID=6850 RepID=A0ABM1SZD3_LIMPO|nr:uncharacterized protein LOC111087256 [Limulus polyphemus]
MRTWIILVACSIAAVTALHRYKRRAYELPDGAELLVGNIRTTFSCPGDGYYADVDNDCKIFHVCHTVTHANGPSEVQQWSFLCGNLTFFNQLTLTCGFADEVVPCVNSTYFFYVNDNIGLKDTLFLTEQDIEKAVPLKARILPPDLRILASQTVLKKAQKAV